MHEVALHVGAVAVFEPTGQIAWQARMQPLIHPPEWCALRCLKAAVAESVKRLEISRPTICGPVMVIVLT